jgi:RHS repeat-associated protein
MVINHIRYDSFGNVLQQTNAAASDRFLFTGREYDSEISLYYYRARYYDPQLGRFISQDPIAFKGRDVNLYRYVLNGPINSTDPSGLLTAAGYAKQVAAVTFAGVFFGSIAIDVTRVVITQGRLPDPGEYLIVQASSYAISTIGQFGESFLLGLGVLLGLKAKDEEILIGKTATGTAVAMVLEDFDDCTTSSIANCTKNVCRHKGVPGPCIVLRIFSEWPEICICGPSANPDKYGIPPEK